MGDGEDSASAAGGQFSGGGALEIFMGAGDKAGRGGGGGAPMVLPA